MVGLIIKGTQYLGTVCGSHPELNGLRRKNNRGCVGCHQDYRRAYRQGLVHREYMKEFNTRPEQAAKAVIRARIRNQLVSEKAAKDFGWWDRQILACNYAIAKVCRDNGVDVVVDHIVPLKGENVRGLHVGANTRVISGLENNQKGNYHEV